MAAAPFLVAEGEKQARAGNIDRAIATFRKALEWSPNLDLNPDTEAIEKDPEAVARSLAALEEGERLARFGKVIEAIAAYKEAQQLDPEIDLNPDTAAIEKDPEAVARPLAAPA